MCRYRVATTARYLLYMINRLGLRVKLFFFCRRKSIMKKFFVIIIAVVFAAVMAALVDQVEYISADLVEINVSNGYV